MTAALSCYTGLTAGYLCRRGCLSFVFGTLHHHCGSVDNTRGGLVERTKDGRGPKLTGSEVDTHTHTPTFIHSHRCANTNKRAHTRINTLSFQPAPHLGAGYFRKERSIRTHTASSSLPLPPPAATFPLAPSKSSALCCFSLVLTPH